MARSNGSARHRGRDLASLVWRELRRPSANVVGQSVRFALSGGTVAAVYVLTTLLLSDVLGVAFQAALVIGFTTGLVVNFILQRAFVWRAGNRFALPLHHQAGRYLASAAAQYAVTAASTSLLPSLLGVPTELVYLATVAAVIPVSFLILRSAIFQREADY